MKRRGFLGFLGAGAAAAPMMGPHILREAARQQSMPMGYFGGGMANAPVLPEAPPELELPWLRAKLPPWVWNKLFKEREAEVAAINSLVQQENYSGGLPSQVTAMRSWSPAFKAHMVMRVFVYRRQRMEEFEMKLWPQEQSPANWWEEHLGEDRS